MNAHSLIINIDFRQPLLFFPIQHIQLKLRHCICTDRPQLQICAT